MQNFTADLNRINASLHAMGAVVTTDDGFTYVNPTVAPAALLDTYTRLVQHGYANGWL